MTPGGGHWGMWPAQPLLVPLLLAVPLALYLAGWWRAARGGRIEPARLLAFLAGVHLLVLALASPLHHVAAEYLLSAHMVQHVLVGDLAPLLLVLGVSGPLAGTVPAWLLRLAGPPSAAFGLWAAATAGWYVPGVFERALATPWLHALMQASVLLAGLAAWAHIIGVAPRRGTAAQRAAFAFGLMAAGTAVAQWLFLSGPLYDVYIDQPERLLGLTPTADQTKAALIMASEGMLTMVAAAALLMWAHVDRAAEEAGVRDSRPCAPPGSSP